MDPINGYFHAINMYCNFSQLQYSKILAFAGTQSQVVLPAEISHNIYFCCIFRVKVLLRLLCVLCKRAFKILFHFSQAEKENFYAIKLSILPVGIASERCFIFSFIISCTIMMPESSLTSRFNLCSFILHFLCNNRRAFNLGSFPEILY